VIASRQFLGVNFMFQSLSERLTKAFDKLTGRGRLTEENIQKALKDVKTALLDADVALPVIKDFLASIRRGATGREVMRSLSPAQTLIKIVQAELTALMGQANETLNLATQPPAVILLAGLQGSGKTTSAAKLARFLKERHKKRVAMVSCDIYRPAAIEQLAILGKEIGVEVFPSNSTEDPLAIVKGAMDFARRQTFDVLLIDTAGRLHIDEAMMKEVKAIHSASSPIETLFVVDSMTGQDAANTAKAFNDALPLTGVILTKVDGDARGGAALSIRYLTEKPIKFLGVGEKVEALEPFHPDRVASRILGMGDILSLIEEAEHKIDKEKSDQIAKKIRAGQGFSLEDFRDQLKEMDKMGGVMGMVNKLPGLGGMSDSIKEKGTSMMKRMVAVIDSMTLQERKDPDILKNSRKVRISKGSGIPIPEINRMLKQFEQMQKMMKKMGNKRSMLGMMGQVKSLMGGGGMPRM
jgi:signal recognition particle subunit SRP54